jgi:hypothetical protein
LYVHDHLTSVIGTQSRHIYCIVHRIS